MPKHDADSAPSAIDPGAGAPGLALETTSSLSGEVALSLGETVLEVRRLPPALRSAQGLIPLAQTLLRDRGLSVSDIRWLAVCVGPGSFTGIRVAVTLAKLMGWATGCDLVAIDACDAVVADLPATAHAARVVVDAQRNEASITDFRRVSGQWRRTAPPRIVPRSDLTAGLATGVWVVGPKTPWFAAFDCGLDSDDEGGTGDGPFDALRQAADPERPGVGSGPGDRDSGPGVGLHFVFGQPRAETIARLGWQARREGRTVDPFELSATYLRPSAAEEKRRS